MHQLTSQQNKIHTEAVTLAKNHRAVEASLIAVLRNVERLAIHKALGKNSLFSYAVEVLGLEKNVAYPMITIARKSLIIPELKDAIENQKLSVSKASRIVASLNSSDAVEWIEFAQSHTRDEIDFEVAKKNPRVRSRDKMKPISEDAIEIKMCISSATFEKLKRAESLEAQKGKGFKWGDVLDSSLEVYLEKNDPVRKAKRASKRKSELGRARVVLAEKEAKSIPKPKLERIPLTAEQKHAVFLRDQGKCKHENVDGHRCGSDKWIQIHHIIPVSQGGTNALENLETLCSFHHDLVHQLSLPIEGQVTWLRSPQAKYG